MMSGLRQIHAEGHQLHLRSAPPSSALTTSGGSTATSTPADFAIWAMMRGGMRLDDRRVVACAHGCVERRRPLSASERLSLRSVAGRQRRSRRQQKERRPAARTRLRQPSSASLLFLLVHRQHALGDEEAAEDVDRGERQGDEAEAGGEARRRDADAQAARRPR